MFQMVLLNRELYDDDFDNNSKLSSEAKIAFPTLFIPGHGLTMRRRGRKIEYSVLFPLRCLFRLSNMQNCHMNYSKYEVHSVNRNI